MHSGQARALLPAIAIALIVTASAAARAGSDNNPHWVLVNKAPDFSPRDVAQVFRFGGKYWLSGGWINGGEHGQGFHELWSSEDGITWSPVNLATPYDLYAGMAAFRGRMWAVRESVWNSRDGVQWTKVASWAFDREKNEREIARQGDLHVFKNQLWFMDNLCKVWSSTNGRSWRLASRLPQCKAPRVYSSRVFDNRLWVIGGYIEDQQPTGETGRKNFRTHDDIWSSTDGKSWKRVVEHAPWGPRMWLTTVEHQGALYLINGYDNVHDQRMADLWKSEDGLTWVKIAVDQPFAPRHAATAFSVGDSIALLGGATPKVTNEIWQLSWPRAEDQVAEREKRRILGMLLEARDLLLSCLHPAIASAASIKALIVGRNLNPFADRLGPLETLRVTYESLASEITQQLRSPMPKKSRPNHVRLRSARHS